MIKTAVHPLC